MLAREECRSIAKSGRTGEISTRFSKPLKENHLRAKELLRGNDAARMARVSIESAAREGRHMVALGGGLTCGKARATLYAE
jgi:hypothetical protein